MSGVLLLRGINVGGHGKLAMADLRSVLERLGARDVATYIQSGNAVMRDAPAAEDIADAIEATHGHRPACQILTAEAFHAAIAADPFQSARKAPKSLHYFFCAADPKPVDLNSLAENERAELIGRVLYLHAPDGIGRSKFAAKAERLLGVPATARNYATVSRLAEMLAAIA